MKDPVVLITGALTGIGRDSTRLRERRRTHRCFGPARRRGPWPRPAGMETPARERYIQPNLDKDPTVTGLADVLDMSSYHFALFNGSTEVPPHRFVLRQRIASARRVLATPELVRDGLGVTPEAYPAPAVQEVPAGREGG